MALKQQFVSLKAKINSSAANAATAPSPVR
jgi:hypothetical protein